MTLQCLKITLLPPSPPTSWTTQDFWEVLVGRLPWVAESLKEAPSLAPMLVKEWIGAIGPFPAIPTLLSQSVSLLSPSPTAGPMSTLLLAGPPPHSLGGPSLVGNIPLLRPT